MKIVPLTKNYFKEAVSLVLSAELDTREEIEHHLSQIKAHLVAIDKNKIIGVIGWYQDNVNYADQAMGDKFPGPEAYWVGFFAVEKAYRGKGIGYKLLQKLEESIKKKGESYLYVSSVPETMKYYKRQGFELTKIGYISNNKKFFLVKKLYPTTASVVWRLVKKIRSES